MQALEFWKAVIEDKANFLESLIGLLEERGVRYCVIGGQAVNAYVEPLVSLDLDIVVAVDQLEMVRRLCTEQYRVEEFAHSINLSAAGSNLRVQIQTDPEYFSFVERASPRMVLGLTLPVASLEDLLQGKINAALESRRRPSKRRKDLLDIERLLERYPELRERVPGEILERLS